MGASNSTELSSHGHYAVFLEEHEALKKRFLALYSAQMHYIESQVVLYVDRICKNVLEIINNWKTADSSQIVRGFGILLKDFKNVQTLVDMMIISVKEYDQNASWETKQCKKIVGSIVLNLLGMCHAYLGAIRGASHSNGTSEEMWQTMEGYMKNIEDSLCHSDPYAKQLEDLLDAIEARMKEDGPGEEVCVPSPLLAGDDMMDQTTRDMLIHLLELHGRQLDRQRAVSGEKGCRWQFEIRDGCVWMKASKEEQATPPNVWKLGNFSEHHRERTKRENRRGHRTKGP